MWVADYGEALKQTQEEHRPLLVVLDVPSDPAQRVNPELLNEQDEDSPLGDYELCHVDVSTEYGKRVAAVFRAKNFPHVAIIDKSGSVILDRFEGANVEQKWRSSLTTHRSGLRKSDRRFQVAKPVINAAEAATDYVLPDSVSPSKPFCAACQRNKH